MSKEKKERLDGWKEIASYLDRDPRTVMRWERELGLPIHRIESKGKSIVYALTEEIDAWLSSFSQIAPERRRARLLKTRKRFWLFHLAICSLIVILTVLLIYPWQKRKPNPADFDISGSRLIILDNKGRKLWEYDAGRKLISKKEYKKGELNINPSLLITDLEGDGRREVLFIPIYIRENPLLHPLSFPNFLVCFEASGKIRFILKPGREIRYNKYTTSANYNLGPLLVDDLDGDGKKEIILETHNIPLFPSQLLVLTAQGKVIGEFVNAGHIQRPIVVKDLDNDGYKDIIICGINNTFRSNFLAVFDYRSVFGSSPTPADPEHTSPELARGTMKYYIVLPKIDLYPLLTTYPSATFDITDGEIILKGTIRNDNPDLLPNIASLPTPIFHFDYSLRLTKVELPRKFITAYRELAKKGYLKPLPPDYEKRLAKRVFWWDGDKWVNHPTKTKMWREWE